MVMYNFLLPLNIFQNRNYPLNQQSSQNQSYKNDSLMFFHVGKWGL